MSQLSKCKRSLIAIGYALLAVALPAWSFAGAPETLTRGIVFEPRLGQRVSTVLRFVDEQGQTVRLGDYFRRRPVVLAMGYYRCPMLCGVGLNATARTLEEFPPESPSRDFQF